MIRKIHFLLAICVLFSASVAFASTAEEQRCGRERNADRALWGEKVVSQAYTVTGKVLRLNAFCDDKAFEKIRALRYAAYLQVVGGADESGINATLLRNAIGIDVAPVRDNERLMCNVFSPTIVKIASAAMGNAPLKDREQWGTPAVFAALINNNPHKRPTQKKIAEVSRAETRVRTDKINVREYRYGTVKVDYYRLYLYLWEDVPWDYTANINIFSSQCSISAVTRICLHQPRCRTIRTPNITYPFSPNTQSNEVLV